MEDVILEVRGICKYFGQLVANEDINMSVRRASVHSIIGENGAGKSTLMNMIAGIYKPSRGEVFVNGKKVVFRSPNDAAKCGIGMVHQEFMLYQDLTVLENLMLGFESTHMGVFLDKKKAKADIEAICERYHFSIPLGDLARDLPVSLLQQVEIVKVLYKGADIIILDEPTAVLTPQETAELFRVIRHIIEEKNMTVILITHKLGEVMAISDRVGIMRQGRLVGLSDTKDITEKQIASMMVGRPVLFDKLEKTGAPGETMISVEDLYVRDNRGLVAVNGVSLQARAGEVLGIAAIEGNGQSELLEAITGMRPAISGKITVRGQDSTGLSPGQIRALGLAHVPEDRLATGVDPLADVSDNLLAGRQRDKEFNALGFHLRRSTIERYVSGIYEKFDIRGAGLHGKVGSMSGGNMQKVVVAREFSHDTPVLVISNPSRGIDIGAIEFIHTAIIDKRNEGCAVLLSSADLDEIFRLSDRIITMYEGEITGEFRADDITKEEIGYYMTGSRRKEAEEAHETTH